MAVSQRLHRKRTTLPASFCSLIGYIAEQVGQATSIVEKGVTRPASNTNNGEWQTSLAFLLGRAFSPRMYSLGILTNAAFETLKISVPTILDAVSHRTNYQRCDARLDSWSRRLVEQAGIVIETAGRQHLVPGETYVVMSNHQSHYDIPVVFQALSIPVRMVAKTELFRIPVFGRAMLDSGFIELDRSNRRRAMESLKLAGKRIREDHLSIWIAPEGTRSKDGRVAEFKTGGFHLAREAGVPILPVTLDGTMRVHRSGDSKVHRGETVQVTIHEPIHPQKYGREGVKELMAEVRTAILSHLPNAE